MIAESIRSCSDCRSRKEDDEHNCTLTPDRVCNGEYAVLMILWWWKKREVLVILKLLSIACLHQWKTQLSPHFLKKNIIRHLPAKKLLTCLFTIFHLQSYRKVCCCKTIPSYAVTQYVRDKSSLYKRSQHRDGIAEIHNDLLLNSRW